jgi:flagellar biosynthesis protein FlhB
VSDRTEAPTPRRLRRARDEGDSGASAYASQAAAFVAAAALMPALVAEVPSTATSLLSEALARASRPGGPLAFDVVALVERLASLLIPVLLGVGLVAGVCHLVQTGGVVSAGRLAPRLDRLDPFAGRCGVFSMTGLWAVARATFAGALVGWLVYDALAARLGDLGHLPVHASLAGPVAAVAAQGLVWKVAMAGVALGAIDLAVTRRAWLDRLRMTRVEVRRERRDTEGDPHVKAARARAHQEILAQAVLGSVRRASVVVVNRTNLAFALRYEAAAGDEAPVVVASGEGDLAARIVEAAHEASVPVVCDVPVAGALLGLEVGGAIPEVLYQAVAEILREVSAEAGGRTSPCGL